MREKRETEGGKLGRPSLKSYVVKVGENKSPIFLNVAKGKHHLTKVLNKLL